MIIGLNGGGFFCSFDVLHAKINNMKELEKSWACEGVKNQLLLSRTQNGKNFATMKEVWK